MLKELDLSRELPKQEYKERLPVLQGRLHQLQRTYWKAGLASLLVFEGWNTAGKGSMIRKMTERLEPRGFDLHTTVAPRTVETHLPWMWRFWNRLPCYGHMGIFHRSWHGQVLIERVDGGGEPENRHRRCDDIVSFERTLAADRYEIVKFFLHIDKQEQEVRLRRLAKDPRNAWKVRAQEWDRHARYEAYLVAMEEILQRTDTEWAPWTVVEATDKRWARIKVFETLIGRLENGLESRGHDVPLGLADSAGRGREERDT